MVAVTWTEAAYTHDFDCVPPDKQCYLAYGAMNCIQGAMGGSVTLKLSIKEGQLIFNLNSSSLGTQKEYIINDTTNFWGNFQGTTLTQFLQGKSIDHIIVNTLNREDANEPTYILGIKVKDNAGVLLKEIKPEPIFNPYLVYDVVDALKLSYVTPAWDSDIVSSRVINNTSASIVNLDFVQKSQAWVNMLKTADSQHISCKFGSDEISQDVLDSSLINVSKFTLDFRQSATGEHLGQVLTASQIVSLNNSNPLLTNAVISLVDSRLTVTLETGKYIKYTSTETNVLELGPSAVGFTIGNKTTDYELLNDFQYYDLDANQNKNFGLIKPEKYANRYLITSGCD